MNSSSGWFNASNEDGNLYARAEALGASAVVLATRERTVTYLATKDSASSGKYLLLDILLQLANDLTLFLFIIVIYCTCSFPSY